MNGLALILIFLQGIGTAFSILLYLFFVNKQDKEDNKREEEQGNIEGMSNEEYLKACQVLYPANFEKEGIEDCEKFIDDYLKREENVVTQHPNPFEVKVEEPENEPEVYYEDSKDLETIVMIDEYNITSDYPEDYFGDGGLEPPYELPVVIDGQTEPSFEQAGVECLDERKSSQVSNFSLLEEMRDSLSSGSDNETEIASGAFNGSHVSRRLNEALLSGEITQEEENPFLSKDTTESNPFLEGENQRKKAYLIKKLSYLSNLGEGIDNLREVILTLHELYNIEGRAKDMDELRRQHPEFFRNQPGYVYESDLIFIDMEAKDPFKIPEEYEWLATDGIADKKVGSQKWIGHVVGKNQEYIHFQDKSQRIWIKACEWVNQVDLWELLVVHVERTEETVTARSILSVSEIKKAN